MKLNLLTTLTTDRLILQPVSDTFTVEITKEFTPEVTTYMPYMPVGNIHDTEEFIARSSQELASGKGIQFCILKKDTNEFLGCGGIDRTDTPTPEIGLWLKKDAQRNGYGTEVVQALITLAEKNLEIEYILYPVDRDNHASRRIPEKLGFVQAGTYPKKKSETHTLTIVEYRKLPG